MNTLDPRMPNFFILGAAKSGTTTLYSYLAQHPDIYMPDEKEPHFFNDSENFGLGVDAYIARHFKNSAAFKARGEATPAYFFSVERAIHRLKDVYGDGDIKLKFVLVFRNPVERAWSHYLHMKRIGAEKESFETALELEDERVAFNPNAWFGYFSDGLYSRQLKIWLDYFPREQFLFLLTSDLSNNLEGSLGKLCQFLTVDNYFEDKDFDLAQKENVASEARNPYLMHFLANPPQSLKRIVNAIVRKPTRRAIMVFLRRNNLRPISSSDKPRMLPTTEARLYKKYMSDIVCLEKMIERDLSAWKVD